MEFLIGVKFVWLGDDFGLLHVILAVIGGTIIR
jgi:hypothetical protein